MSCILVFIMLLSALLGMVSCKNNGNGENNGSSTTSDNGAAVIDGLKLVENGELKVSIVYQTRVNAYIKESMDLIQNAVGEVCDKKLTLSVDAFHEHSDDKLEILIGQTEYAASTDAMAALAENSYSISVVGNKIVIAANHPYLYVLAAQKVVESLQKGEGVIAIAKDFSFKSESSSAVSVVSNKTTKYKIVYDKDNEDAKAYAETIRVAFFEIGHKIEVVDDTKNATGLEIIVGETNRGEVESEVKLGYKDALISKDDEGNIFLTGNLKYASECFAEYITVLSGASADVSIIDTMFGKFFP